MTIDIFQFQVIQANIMQKATGNTINEIEGLPFAFGLDNRNISEYLHLFNPAAIIYDGETGNFSYI